MSLSERILGFLAENPGATVREIAECLGLSEVVVRRVLGGLKARGLVARAGRGYVVTERGLGRLRGVSIQDSGAEESGEAHEGIAGSGEEAREGKEGAEREARGEQEVSVAEEGARGGEVKAVEGRGGGLGVDVGDLVRRVEELEARVRALEDALTRLEGLVEELRELVRGRSY